MTAGLVTGVVAIRNADHPGDTVDGLRDLILGGTAEDEADHRTALVPISSGLDVAITGDARTTGGARRTRALPDPRGVRRRRERAR